jgi:hypothetical protein
VPQAVPKIEPQPISQIELPAPPPKPKSQPKPPSLALPPLPSEKERAMYVNTGINIDRRRGNGYYERWFNRRYGKGMFKKFLGVHYENINLLNKSCNMFKLRMLYQEPCKDW